MKLKTVRAALRGRRQLTMPSAVQAALHADEGDEIEFTIAEDGVVTVTALRLVPSGQAWYWTESWQQGEREASEAIASGQLERFRDDDVAFLKTISGD